MQNTFCGTYLCSGWDGRTRWFWPNRFPFKGQVSSWESFVAEFGGALGLFLGFSFISLWDGVELLIGWISPSNWFASMSAVCGCQIDIVEIYMSMTLEFLMKSTKLKLHCVLTLVELQGNHLHTFTAFIIPYNNLIYPCLKPRREDLWWPFCIERVSRLKSSSFVCTKMGQLKA